MPFHWTEIIIYLMPLIMLAVALQLRPLLAKIPRWRLVPVDLVHPTLWFAIHVLSVHVFYFSLFAAVLVMIGILGLWQVISYYRRGQRTIPGPVLLRKISNPLFSVEFIGFYGLVVYRLWELFH
ncbi:MAG: DUF3397 family protein [Aerococcus sp.]|nr:DUF3397 family protein [Aerococcus sp.]